MPVTTGLIATNCLSGRIGRHKARGLSKNIALWASPRKMSTPNGSSIGTMPKRLASSPAIGRRCRERT